MVPSEERPTCLNLGSSDSIFAPPLANGRVGLGLVPFRADHPDSGFQVELSDELAILAHMAMQWRMIGLVHGYLEPVDGLFSHVCSMLSCDNKLFKSN